MVSRSAARHAECPPFLQDAKQRFVNLKSIEQRPACRCDGRVMVDMVRYSLRQAIQYQLAGSETAGETCYRFVETEAT